MTGSTDDDRPRVATPPGEEVPMPAGRCPRCGRALADDACSHCAGGDEFGDAALVRRFVSFPNLYSKDTSPRSWPDPASGEHPGTEEPDPADEPRPGAYRDRVGAGLKAAPTRGLLDPAGWGPRGILAKVVIAGTSILAAAVVGIVGAVVAGPVANKPPGVDPTATGPAAAPALPTTPTRGVPGTVLQGSFCLDDYASGISNGNPIQMWRCDNSDAQRWTFAPDGTVRIFGKCARPVGGASAHGTKVELWDCDRSASQQWHRGPDDSLVHPASGACLEDPTPGDTYGARPRLAVCSNGPAQRWTVP